MKLAPAFICVVVTALVWGAQAGADGKRAPAAAAGVGVERKKSLDFEEEAVEQVNRDPLDSIENLAQRDTQGGGHLYRKTLHFHPEAKRFSRELRRMP